MTTVEMTSIVTFCAEEVRRQKRGPIQVGWMVDAWINVIVSPKSLMENTIENLQLLGHLVEHEANKLSQWRHSSVVILGGKLQPPRASAVPERMVRWATLFTEVEHGNEENAVQLYKEFEIIHPFADGNGRVGKIIYNYVRGTLLNPQFPPNLFGGDVA